MHEKGGVAYGLPHERGGIDGNIYSAGGVPGFKKTGGAVEFEGGEMIFSKKDSKKIEEYKKGGDLFSLGKQVSKAMDKWPSGWDINEAKYGMKLKY